MLICLGTVEGFAAFDPDEKDHILGPAICEVVMKDGEGDVVAKVTFPPCPSAHFSRSLNIAVANFGIHINP